MRENCSVKPFEKSIKKTYSSPCVYYQANKTDGVIKGAIILSLGSLITKILGAFYRIPLTSLLGAEGIGIYQTAFPVYCILLTFSSTGVPSAIAKLVSSGYGEKAVLKKALTVFIPLGILGSLIMLLFSKIISSLQGNPNAYLSYIALSPSVALVSAISCIRGYFQGKCNMIPTALSQVIEQAVKLTFGLCLCYFINGSPAVKGGLACLAVTLSELVATLYLLICYKSGKSHTQNTLILSFKRLIATLLPIVITSLTLPISRVFDSFTIVNLLKTFTSDASSLYGIYTGSVESVAGVPIAICYGVATASLPKISKAKAEGNFKEVKALIKKAISLTLFLSTLAGLVLFFFSYQVTDLLFKSFPQDKKIITAKLLSLSFFTVVGLSLVQTLNACLIAYGKPLTPCAFLSIGVAIKILLQLVLLKNPEINVFGALYSDIVCYFVAVFLDLLYIIYTIYRTRGKIKV